VEVRVGVNVGFWHIKRVKSAGSRGEFGVIWLGFLFGNELAIYMTVTWLLLGVCVSQSRIPSHLTPFLS